MLTVQAMLPPMLCSWIAWNAQTQERLLSTKYVLGLQLLEIDNPVADQKGYVYEKSAVERYIRENRGCTRCPATGMYAHKPAHASFLSCACFCFDACCTHAVLKACLHDGHNTSGSSQDGWPAMQPVILRPCLLLKRGKKKSVHRWEL